MLHVRMEESLKTVLHCDDKEKLREKLALLQREYNRTVQRLQRAERSEAVRKHVRSRIAEQNLMNQQLPDKNSPSKPSEPEEEKLSPFSQGNHADHSKSAVVRFSLPCDARSPCGSPRGKGGSSGSSCLSGTPQACSPSQQDGGLLPVQGHRRRSAHRLRSRRSRLRWERRERADSGVSDTENSEDGQEDRGRAGSSVDRFSTENSLPEAVPKPAALCSQGDGPRGPPMEGAETEAVIMQETRSENVSASASEAMQGSNSRLEGDSAPLLSEVHPLDTQTAAIFQPAEMNKISLPPTPTMSPSKTEEARSGLMNKALAEECEAADPPAAGCLSSCTLVEGLLFPVEYYVRTTRRMSSAQSSVDLGAVIQSQLSQGRRGRGRGRGRGRRGRGGSRAARSSEHGAAASNSQTLSCKAPDSLGYITPESQSSQTLCSSPAAPDAENPCAKPIRGRRRRGRGRGCGQGQRRSYALSVVSAADSTAPEPIGADSVPPDTDTRPGPTEKDLYPIFHTKSRLIESASPKIARLPFIKLSSQSNQKECLRVSNRSSTEGLICEPLLLPSSPAVQRPHVVTLGGNDLGLRFLLSHLDMKDFDLPDDEFGRLKLDKLRSPAGGDLEAFVPLCSPYHTRRRASRTPSSNRRHKKSPLSNALLSPPSTVWTQCKQPAEGPAQLGLQTSDQADLGSVRDTPESLTPSLAFSEVIDQGEGQGCVELPPETDESTESMLKPSPLVGECTGSVKTASTGPGDLAGPVQEGEDCAMGAPSPHVLNLSPTPTVHTQKGEALSLPLWGSPTLPSLGFTPALALHPSSPTVDCSALTPSKGLGPLTHPTLQSLTQGSTVSSEPNRASQPRPLSQTPFPHAQGQSQNAPCSEPANKEESVDGDQCATSAPFPDSADHTLSDLVLCPAVERRGTHPSPCPQRVQCNESQLPVPGHPALPCAGSPLPSVGEEGADGDEADVPSSTKVPVSAQPSLCLRDEREAVLQSSQCPSVSLPLPESGRQGHADTGNSTDTACEVEADRAFTLNAFSTDPESAQSSPKAQAPGAAERSVPPPTPVPATLLPSSLREEYGEKDLDRYFTDSAWARGAGTPPQTGQGSPEQEPMEAKLGTPPSSAPASSLRLTHTLEAPAGRCLVDMCVVHKATGWCVATAGEWAVCVWEQSSPQHWSLLHTWTFNEHPVIALFSVPDAPSLLCVTLGQLEIREARVLWCGGAGGPLSQLVLHTGEMQVVLGVSEGRVACCATAVSTQTVRVFTLTEDGRLEDSLSLVSPGQIVRALAVVEGQKDALIGSTDSHLVLWNMRTGHLLQQFSLSETFSGTVCLRGYSESGILFVLLQHRFLCKLNAEEGPFSLIATNPVTARSVLVQHLTQPSLCKGRFMDGDVCGSSVVAVFQSGALAVWDLRHSDSVARVAWGPEEGCHLARWSHPNTLLTGHLNGDVSLYQYTLL